MNQKVCKQFHPFASSEMTFQSAQRERFLLLCFITLLFHKKTDCYIFYFALVFLFASSTRITAQHGLSVLFSFGYAGRKILEKNTEK